jgi:hypothetical protein
MFGVSFARTTLTTRSRQATRVDPARRGRIRREQMGMLRRWTSGGD